MVSNEEIKRSLEKKKIFDLSEDDINCSNCDIANPSNAYYCNECGSDLHRIIKKL